jgi:replicative DNA helicase
VLLDHHRAKLVACGLALETWSRARLHSGSVDEVRELLGYGGAGTGLVIPYDDHYARVRIDNPGPDGKRYRSPRGEGNRLYVPSILEPSVLADPTRLLYVTEGELKALKATQETFPCIALPGVWSWKAKVHGKSLPIADLDRVSWKGRRSIIVFDSDLTEKPPVAWAEHELVKELRHRGADVYLLRLPEGPKGAKLGFDDYLVAEGAQAFKQLPMKTVQDADAEGSPFRRMSDLADEYLLRLGQRHHRLLLGYAGLDAVIRGVAPGEVLTIIARTGVGKTTLLQNLTTRMSGDGQLPSMIFSLEQQGVELFERYASMWTGYAGREIEDRARAEDPAILARLQEVVERWEACVIVERPCTLEEMDRLIEQARSIPLWAEPLRLVCVDYMGLVGLDRSSPLYEQTSRVARGLKNLAKRHHVALAVACQVDREGGSGGDPVSLKMARDSGAIEEAADYLLGCWRPELAENLSKEEKRERRGQFVIRVLKNRSGAAPRTVRLHFDAASLRIEEPAAPLAGAEPEWVKEDR